MINPGAESNRLIVFRVSGHFCALRLETVSEIVPMARLYCPPGMPAIVLGFLNLAGTAVPVLRLDRLCGFTDQPIELYSPLVLVRCNAGIVALLTENVKEIRALSSGEVLPVETRDSFNGCVESAFNINGECVHVLSINNMLLEKERRAVMDHRDREQQRLAALAPIEGPRP